MNVIEQVTQYRHYSAASWQSAINHDDQNRGFEADRDACLKAYDDAIAYLDEGDYNNALIALEEAADHERAGGDDEDARNAILAVFEAWGASI
jgi:thioredoxin-like negative regulator of GroEL